MGSVSILGVLFLRPVAGQNQSLRQRLSSDARGCEKVYIDGVERGRQREAKHSRERVSTKNSVNNKHRGDWLHTRGSHVS